MPAPRRTTSNIQTGAQQTPRLFGHAHPMMVLDDYVAQVREIRRQRRARLAALKTRRDVLKYQERVLGVIATAFAPFPKRTPLNARITGVHELKYCRVENILFESRPGCLVTGNLYLPHSADARHPVPGVIADCGHALDGKHALPYQSFPQRLAAAGFATLLIEPFNQGERDQYFGLPGAKQVSGNCCDAHNMMGKQLELIGEFFGSWRAWDDIRALDYLLSRPEVDTTRVGMTGNSGAGTMTTWTWALDPRLTMAAPSCFNTTFAANLENELPADAEQYPPGVLAAGLEQTDFIIARAPKPCILLGQKFDFFDRRGMAEARAEIQRVYALLDAPRAHELFVGPTRHGYSPHNQRAMVEFFHRHARIRSPLRQLADAELVDQGQRIRVTPQGNVIAAGAIPIYRQIQTITERIDRPRLTQQRLIQTIRKVLQLHDPFDANSPPHFRILRPNFYDRYRAARFAVETESRDRNGESTIRAFLQKIMATDGNSLDVERDLTLWLPHVSAEAELNDRKLAGRLIGKCALYALDVRGSGESMPLRAPDLNYFAPYGFDYMMHGHGLMLNRSYFGRRVFDVLRTLELLVSAGARRITLHGRGQGALLALYAGVLAPKAVARVVAENAPRSYLEWTSAPLVSWPAANMPFGVLKHFDLPELVRALGRRVKVIAPWDAQMRSAR